VVRALHDDGAERVADDELARVLRVRQALVVHSVLAESLNISAVRWQLLVVQVGVGNLVLDVVGIQDDWVNLVLSASGGGWTNKLLHGSGLRVDVLLLLELRVNWLLLLNLLDLLSLWLNGLLLLLLLDEVLDGLLEVHVGLAWLSSLLDGLLDCWLDELLGWLLNLLDNLLGLLWLSELLGLLWLSELLGLSLDLLLWLDDLLSLDWDLNGLLDS
jgi:hypothetical protein